MGHRRGKGSRVHTTGALSALGPELGAVGMQRRVHPATPGFTDWELLTPLATPFSLILQKGKCLRVKGCQLMLKFFPFSFGWERAGAFTDPGPRVQDAGTGFQGDTEHRVFAWGGGGCSALALLLPASERRSPCAGAADRGGLHLHSPVIASSAGLGAAQKRPIVAPLSLQSTRAPGSRLPGQGLVTSCDVSAP